MKKIGLGSFVGLLLSSIGISNIVNADGVANTEGSISYIVSENGNETMDPDPDPEKPPIKIPSTEDGPFAIAFAPKLIFGEQENTTSDKTYSAEALKFFEVDDQGNPTAETQERAHFAQIRDLRGTSVGWTLSIEQDEKGFITSDGDILKGAELRFNDGKEISSTNTIVTSPSKSLNLKPGVASNLLIAENNNGDGLSTIMWGTRTGLENGKNSSVQLYVPGATIKKKKQYTTNLAWMLTSAPENR